MKIAAACFLGLLSPLVSFAQAASDDPYAWLEDVSGDRALTWARAQNAVSQRELEASPNFKPIYDRLLTVLDSNARIPYVTKEGGLYYNFWHDAQHPRGVWRRTTLAEYRKPEPAWETVLDLDALAAAEKESWVWNDVLWLRPQHDRVLLELSRGGGDAVVIREFDLMTKSFVTDGFNAPEAKTDVAWRNRDSIYIGSNFGADSTTTSGYARIVKEWKRGTPLSAARTVFAGEVGDVSVRASVSERFGFHHEFIRRGLTFFTSEIYLCDSGQPVKLDVPLDAIVGSWREFMTVTLRKDWTVGGKTYPAGAYLVIAWDKFLAGGRDFDELYIPGPRKSLDGVNTFAHHIVVNELDNVRSRLYRLTRAGSAWNREPLPAPEFGQLSVENVDDESDDYFLEVTDFVTPTSLYLGTLEKDGRELLKQMPALFNADGLEVSQHEVVSKDGTRVPYFQVSRRGVVLDGTAPTLLYAYGGFQISETPNYSATRGAGWLERGGVFVLANLRGGGEFGPAWHQAALRENRQRAYDDFIATAEDLIKRRVTSSAHLGIQGGSNGGLLMGVMLTERPDLFGAIVCQSPLLDMKRYNHLLAGASWMGEYGNPDVPADWAFISRYSPYQNVKADAKYPRILFTTSTRDDRVHPGHARKMAAQMEAQHHDVLFYENIEGGHSRAVDNKQQAYVGALAYTFLWQQLK